MIDATKAGREADFTLGERAKRRSVHNSYMTFPLLFIMLSNHYPATYASPVNWLVLLLLFVAGAAARHAMIGRGSSAHWALVPTVAALAGAMFFSAPKHAAGPPTAADAAPSFAAVRGVVMQRCLPCHSRFRSDPTFGAAPAGVAFDTPESIARLAERIRVRAVETQTMPLANKTGMTPDERALLARWIAEFAEDVERGDATAAAPVTVPDRPRPSPGGWYSLTGRGAASAAATPWPLRARGRTWCSSTSTGPPRPAPPRPRARWARMRTPTPWTWAMPRPWSSSPNGSPPSAASSTCSSTTPGSRSAARSRDHGRGLAPPP